MFSERLEKLIQSSLQDGILTDQEKAAIIKRAKAEGEDIDEVEIYIDSLLQKRQKELNNSDVKRKANTSGMDELKHLIDAAMADGIITSKEREVITRKAAALGMDAAEVEVYLDAEIQKAEQAANIVKREKIGKVCPKCGKQVPPLTIKCECGYEFKEQGTLSSSQILCEKIEKINSRPMKHSPGSYDGDAELDNRNSEIIDLISIFPVPNSKEDIVEFISMAVPNSNLKGGLWGTFRGRLIIFLIVAAILFVLPFFFSKYDFDDTAGMSLCIEFVWGIVGWFIISMADKEILRYNKRAMAWRAKLDQVLMKGRSLRGDAEFTQQLDYYENMLNKK